MGGPSLAQPRSVRARRYGSVRSEGSPRVESPLFCARSAPIPWIRPVKAALRLRSREPVYSLSDKFLDPSAQALQLLIVDRRVIRDRLVAPAISPDRRART